MSISGTKTVIDGLVFSYDAGSRKSYNNPPIQNIATEITTRGAGQSTYYNFSAGIEKVFIPSIGWIDSPYMDMWNDYPNSGNCCPSPFTYGNGISCLPSTLYTYAIVYKSVNRYYNANYMYHYELNGGTYLTEYGVHMVGGYSGTERHLGDDWYWSSSKFTTQATTNILNTGAWMYQYLKYNRLYIAKVLIAPGDWTQVHPSLWPDVGTTISNTQVISDLTGNNNITANSLTYETDGSFSFNGTSNYINTSVIGSYSSYTIEMWCKINGTTGTQQRIFSSSSGGTHCINTTPPGQFGFHYNPLDGSPSSTGAYTGVNVEYNTWYHIVATNDSTNSASGAKIYLNGELKGSQEPAIALNGNVYFGSDRTVSLFSNSTISIGKIYNRALTAAEVRQNFNAIRGRYGL